jgi:hypothetical protein
MKRVFHAAVFVAIALLSTASFAKDLPVGGLTVEEVAKWLQDAGYKAEIQTAKDGTKNVKTAADGTDIYVDMYDCSKPKCTSIQFSAGFNTTGAWNGTKMNDFNRDNRWVKAYVDKKDDPWIQMDVDLYPGGTKEGLDDHFIVFHQLLVSFKKYINWTN